MIESIGKKRRGRKSIIDIGAAVEIDVILVAQAPVRPQQQRCCTFRPLRR